MIRLKIVVLFWLVFTSYLSSQEELQNCILKGLELVEENDLEVKLSKKEKIVFLVNFFEGSNAYKVVVIPKSFYHDLIEPDKYYPKGYMCFKRIDCLLFGDIPGEIDYSRNLEKLNFLKLNSKQQESTGSDLPPRPPIIIEPNVYTFVINVGCSVISIRIDDSLFSL